jgi:hypothetical protein
MLKPCPSLQVTLPQQSTVSSLAMKGIPSGGFNFDNCRRNEVLASDVSKAKMPQAYKTGTTIVGVVFKVCFWLI